MSTVLDRIAFAAREGHNFNHDDVIELLRQHRVLIECARSVISSHSDPESVTKAASMRALRVAVKDCDGESK